MCRKVARRAGEGERRTTAHFRPFSGSEGRCGAASGGVGVKVDGKRLQILIKNSRKRRISRNLLRNNTGASPAGGSRRDAAGGGGGEDAQKTTRRGDYLEREWGSVCAAGWGRVAEWAI